MEDLLLYYVRYCVEEPSLQGKMCMERFYKGRFPKEFSEPTLLQQTLKKKCKLVEKENMEMFHDLAENLQLDDPLQDVLQPMMTEGRGMNYGCLVVLVSFCGFLCDRYVTIHTMSQFVLLLEKLYNFFKTTVNPWVCEHGGLEELHKFLCITEENSQTLSNLNIGGVFVLLYLLFC